MPWTVLLINSVIVCPEMNYSDLGRRTLTVGSGARPQAGDDDGSIQVRRGWALLSQLTCASDISPLVAQIDTGQRYPESPVRGELPNTSLIEAE